MKYNTQNVKIASITEKTLIVGIDIGSKIHFARAFDWRNYEYTRKPFKFSNSEAGFQAFKTWLEELQEKNGKSVVIPGMEPIGHYWFALGKFLQDNGMKPVHVNPHHVKKSKELDDNNPNKNDRKDPKTIAGLMNKGHFSYPYISNGVYVEIRSLSNQRFQAQEELARAKNRIARWFSIYFPEYKDVYRDLKAVSGRMVLQAAPLPEDIRELGVEGVNQIWREAKLRGSGMKRAKALVSVAEHSIGSKEAPEAARMELRNLLKDMYVYATRVEGLLGMIEEKIKEIPYIDKLMAIKGVGSVTVSGFVAEVGASDVSIVRNSCRSWQDMRSWRMSQGNKGESRISYRGRKRLRYVLYEVALSLISRNQKFKTIHEYYWTRRANPLKKMKSKWRSHGK